MRAQAQAQDADGCGREHRTHGTRARGHMDEVINNLFLVVNFGIGNNLCIVNFIFGGCYWLFAC